VLRRGYELLRSRRVHTLLPLERTNPFHAQYGIVVKKTDVVTLGVLSLLGIAMPAFAQYEGPSWIHSVDTYYSHTLQYHPFRVQVAGGGTITQRAIENDLSNGWNVGAGLTWYPTSHLPLGLRLDGIYNQFSPRGALLDQATARYQTRVDSGTIRMWGGDVDLEIDFHLGASVRLYLVGGGGWYRQQTTYRQQVAGATGCDWWRCGAGSGNVDAIVARDMSKWHFARNVGLGMEFALGERASFFVDARYMQLDPRRQKSDFLPIRAGLRF
jgi:opacity protein-like surface antigen